MRCLVLVGLLALVPRAASADDNDLVLGRLATRITDGSGNLTGVVAQNLELRSLASQLGVVLAPHLLTPADTLGFGGFQFSLDYQTTSIDSKAAYWRALESSPDPTGTSGVANGAGMMRTLGLFVRKGAWFPGLELGAGGVHLIDSHIWTGQLYAKVALHEGYHQLPIPSLAVRGAVSRMMNQRELDLTIASLDVTVSKHLGIGGTWRLDPFAGWDLLMIIPRSEVIDATPNIDPLTPGNEMDASNNFVFHDQSTIFRQQFFFGAKFQYYVFELALQASFTLHGSSLDDRPGTSTPCLPGSMTTACDAKDTAKSQSTLALSAGFDF